MENNIKEVPTKLEDLKKKNDELQQKLKEAMTTIDLIKAGKVDALVEAGKKDLKIYAEKTIDKTYRVLIEKMHEGCVALNKEGIILYCNSSFGEMLNTPLQKLIGTKLTGIINQASKDQFEKLIQEGWEKATTDELYIYGYNGKAIPLLLSLNKLPMDDEPVLSIIFTDITIQKKGEEELRMKIELLEEAGKLAEIGIWVVDLKTNKVTVSDQLYKIYGLDNSKDSHNFSPYELIHKNALEVSKMIFETAVKDLGSFDTYTVIKLPDSKEEKKLHIKGKVISRGGEAYRLIGITQDMSALPKE
jgi:PAS domain S-box-containing protein